MGGGCSWGLALGPNTMRPCAIAFAISVLCLKPSRPLQARDSGSWWIARSLGGAVGGWFLAPCRFGIVDVATGPVGPQVLSVDLGLLLSGSKLTLPQMLVVSFNLPPPWTCGSCLAFWQLGSDRG
jgi:hypothetical protein